MALTALPEDNTARYFLRYTVAGFEHVMTQRVSAGITDSDAIAAYEDFLATLEDLVYLATIVGLEKSASGSNVRNPVTWTGAPQFGADAAPDGSQASSVSFVGRSFDGRKVRLFAYAFKGSFPTDFRLTNGENASVASAVAVLNGMSGTFLTISGQHPVWRPYMNVGVNDHFVKESRA